MDGLYKRCCDEETFNITTASRQLTKMIALQSKKSISAVIPSKFYELIFISYSAKKTSAINWLIAKQQSQKFASNVQQSRYTKVLSISIW